MIIELTSGKKTIVDDYDYRFLKLFTWYESSEGYAVTRRNNEYIYLHRLIMDASDNELVDHKDGDPLNNQKENLRIATKSQNGMNQKVQRKKKTSKYKGVSWDKDRFLWKANIVIEGKQKYLGRYFSEEDAAKAYNSAATKYFGEFALLNNIEEAIV